MTGGLFDPTILPSIKAAGYDADFATVIARGGDRRIERVIVDEVLGTVDLPAGIGIGPGAIGKGLAAVIIVDELMGVGADGELVNLGGDIVFVGIPGDDPAWILAIEDERVAIEHPDRVIHHLEFEPGIARGDLVQVTVVADMGWRAEAAATAALLMGAGRAPQ